MGRRGGGRGKGRKGGKSEKCESEEEGKSGRRGGLAPGSQRKESLYIRKVGLPRSGWESDKKCLI